MRYSNRDPTYIIIIIQCSLINTPHSANHWQQERIPSAACPNQEKSRYTLEINTSRALDLTQTLVNWELRKMNRNYLLGHCFQILDGMKQKAANVIVPTTFTKNVHILSAVSLGLSLLHQNHKLGSTVGCSEYSELQSQTFSLCLNWFRIEVAIIERNISYKPKWIVDNAKIPDGDPHSPILYNLILVDELSRVSSEPLLSIVSMSS